MSEPFVGSRGPRDAKIMVVGEAYGAQEDMQKQPFVGGSGTVISEMLLSVGVDPDKVFFTNIVNKRPPKNYLGAWFSQDKRGLPNDIVMAGLRALKQEIAEVNPNVIIPVGSYPLALLTGKGRWGKVDSKWTFTGIGDYRGYVLRGSPITGHRKCIPTYHPANILRQYSNKHISKIDFALAFAESGSPEIRRPRKLLITDPRGAQRDAWTRWLLSSAGQTPRDCGVVGQAGDGVYTSETEALLDSQSGQFLTSDIEYPANKLSCVGFTRHADIGVCLPTRNEGERDFVRDILLSGHPLCWQNGMFDASILHWFYGIDVYKYIKHDTMIGMHVAYTEFPKDLGFIGSIFGNDKNGCIEYWKDAIDWDKISTGQQSITEVYKYNCGDVWLTHSAMEQMLADELTEPSHKLTYEREMSYVEPLYRFSARGVKIDNHNREALKTSLEGEIETLKSGLALLAGRSVNPRSGDQVAKLLYDDLNITPRGPRNPPTVRKTEGSWKMDDTTLAQLSLRCKNDKQRTAIKLVREARKRASLISKFCNIKLDDDGRLRCHYDPAKTQTGRLASRTFYPTGRGSNLQNVPRDSRVRAVFVPDDGYVLGNADLKQAESLVVAHLSGDPEMLRLHSDEYMSGKLDGHKYVAAFLIKDSVEDAVIEAITGEERQIGKTCRHALNYMLGPTKLMNRINKEGEETGVYVTLAQCKRYHSKYQQLHPMLPQWWNRTARILGDTHTLHTLLGRPHTFYDRPSDILPEAVAFVPQGTVADALNIGLVRCNGDPILIELGYQPLLQVHDSIVFQAPKSTFDLVAARVKDLLRVPINITGRPGYEPYELIIPVDLEYGWNWGKMDKPKGDKPVKNPNGLRPWSPDAIAA